MGLYFSASTNGFYDDNIHGGNMPDDVVTVTPEEHAALMDAQSTGKIISHNIDGRPEAVYPIPPTTEELWAAVRLQRDRLLAACDWTQISDSPLSATAKAAWAAYRQALRDVPAQTDPANLEWPSEPK